MQTQLFLHFPTAPVVPQKYFHLELFTQQHDNSVYATVLFYRTKQYINYL